jgi:hypothetical protein
VCVCVCGGRGGDYVHLTDKKLWTEKMGNHLQQHGEQLDCESFHVFLTHGASTSYFSHLPGKVQGRLMRSNFALSILKNLKNIHRNE